jgi:hypothetical protein
MTPYNQGTSVIIDPNIKNVSLMFGKVDKEICSQVGLIIKVNYFKPKRCTCYLVQFEQQSEKEALWFSEEELITIYTK